MLPEGLNWAITAAMMLAAAGGAAVTTALGAGGGLLLLVLLAQWVPPAALVPVHGLVQLAANIGRAGMTLWHIRWTVVLAFLPGALIGAWLASRVLVTLPEPVWMGLIGGFVLVLAWAPKLPVVATGPWGTGLAAALTTFASLFVGATGPLVAAFVRQMGYTRFATVGTFAACMVIQHAPKAVAFGAVGFILRDWIGFIALLMASTLIGNAVGVRLLARLDDTRFHLLLKIALTLLALRLLWLAAP